MKVFESSRDVAYWDPEQYRPIDFGHNDFLYCDNADDPIWKELFFNDWFTSVIFPLTTFWAYVANVKKS